MRNRLQQISSEEGAREILKKMLKDGKITIEDLDKESPHSAFNRQIVEKYYPAIKLKPHRNLLRDPKPIEAVQASADPRDFDPRPVSRVSDDSTQVLRPQEKKIHSKECVGHSKEKRLSKPLPF